MTMPGSTPGPGHNIGGAISRSEALAESVDRAVRDLANGIGDREQAGQLQELMTQCHQCEDALDSELKAERKGFDEAIGQIVTRYRPAQTRVGLCKTALRRLLTPWLQGEDRRLQQEATQRRLEAEAAKRAAERAADKAAAEGGIEALLDAERAAEAAADAEAAARPAARAQIRGDLAPKAMSLVARWTAEIVDEDRALAHFARNAEVRDAALDKIRQVASRLARQLKDARRAPPGCRFVRKEEAR
jgi:hypothetical protein